MAGVASEVYKRIHGLKGWDEIEKADNEGSYIFTIIFWPVAGLAYLGTLLTKKVLDSYKIDLTRD